VRARVHSGGFPFTTLSPYPAFRRLGQRQHRACLERRAEPSPQPRRHAVPSSIYSSRLETGPRHQQNCTDCHKENARPVRSEPQESHAAPWRLQSVANRPGGIRTAKRSPPNSSAHHVQDSAENEQRAKPYQEHSRLSIHRRHAQQNLDSRQCTQIRSGTNAGSPAWFG
jgi:hypothetical protein